MNYITFPTTMARTRRSLRSGRSARAATAMDPKPCDPPETYLGGERPPLSDFDEEAVHLAEKFSRQHELPWPPEVGDFDRYYDWLHNP